MYLIYLISFVVAHGECASSSLLICWYSLLFVWEIVKKLSKVIPHGVRLWCLFNVWVFFNFFLLACLFLFLLRVCTNSVIGFFSNFQMHFFYSWRAKTYIMLQFLGEILVDLIDRSNRFHPSGKRQDLLKNILRLRISTVPNNSAIRFINALLFKTSSFPKLINIFVDTGIIDMLLVRKGHRQNNLRHVKVLLFENGL